jgi:hypothetical protein
MEKVGCKLQESVYHRKNNRGDVGICMSGVKLGPRTLEEFGWIDTWELYFGGISKRRVNFKSQSLTLQNPSLLNAQVKEF